MVYFKQYIALFLILAVISCDKPASNTTTQTPNASTPTFDAFEKQDLGNGVMRLTRTTSGVLFEEGYTLNGQKHGMWIVYNSEGKPATITNYAKGQKDGKSFKFTGLAQLESTESYKAGVPHGEFSTYSTRFNVQRLKYNDGQLHGVQQYYFTNGPEKGKLQREVEYKNGKMDGIMRQYDGDGNPVVEYVYKNGEKVSGGIVE